MRIGIVFVLLQNKKHLTDYRVVVEKRDEDEVFVFTCWGRLDVMSFIDATLSYVQATVIFRCDGKNKVGGIDFRNG